MTIIDSDYFIDNIEQHFKIIAGPGAGKTHFLVNHIRNILSNSKRLKIQRKIACITYTNVATEAILARIKDHGGKLEISTINSFLYKYLVKPYVHLIASDYDLDAVLINGHDEILFSSYGFIEEWKTTTRQHYLDHQDVIKAWEKLRWKFDGNNQLVVQTPYPIRSGGYNIKTNSYLEYKKMVWKKGLLHHDDVLFFSYQLAIRFPFVLNVLRAIFPYFLVDEFQDTSPIQIALLKLLGQSETIVGIVGDEAQSIYSFLGAEQGQLGGFLLPGLAIYMIQDNRRSSNQIVNLLNQIRINMSQNAIRNINISDVVVLVGDKLSALTWVESKYAGTEIVSLSRENIVANSLKKGIAHFSHRDLFAELKKNDSNSARRRSIANALKSVEYVKMGYIKDALKTMGKLFNYNTTILDQKKSLTGLKKLLDNYDKYSGRKVMDLVLLIQNESIDILTRLKTGAAKSFYENTDYDQMALSVRNLYEAGSHRTVHKAKGEEFDTVLVVFYKEENGSFNESNELGFLLAPDIEENEEHRIKYVALSRAKNNLIISLPLLSLGNKASLINMGIVVENLP